MGKKNKTRSLDSVSEEIVRQDLEKKQKERAEKCKDGILKLLEDHKCEIFIGLQFGQTTIPAGQVLAVPTIWGVMPK